MSNKKKIQNESGFSLMELIVVIAIIAIVASFSIPTLFNPQVKLKTVARQLMGDMQRAKMEAIKEYDNRSIVFGADGYTIQDSGGGVLKTIDFDDYVEGVVYGHGAATTNATEGGGVFPADEISYAPNILTFNPRGTCNEGWVYLSYRDAAYAVGSTTAGGIKIRVWSGGAWR